MAEEETNDQDARFDSSDVGETDSLAQEVAGASNIDLQTPSTMPAIGKSRGMGHVNDADVEGYCCESVAKQELPGNGWIVYWTYSAKDRGCAVRMYGQESHYQELQRYGDKSISRGVGGVCICHLCLAFMRNEKSMKARSDEKDNTMPRIISQPKKKGEGEASERRPIGRARIVSCPCSLCSRHQLRNSYGITTDFYP
ncbi:S-adenosylmethionine decarboxylase proenzyme-like [Sesbania bispinosa]|nr:S-adenosylmethionine decarboxylase proenzyme-like [Sesbania bispinosa]